MAGGSGSALERRELAEDGVDEAGRAAEADLAQGLDGVGDGGVLRHAGEEELVGADAQRGEHAVLHGREGAVGVREDGVVEGELAAGRAVAELGGEACVARVARLDFVEDGVEDDVQVGVFKNTR